ncbi:MAG: transposase [Planctomycetes bacterium]|nr:transposase [Planctomycetota bacterium]
MTKRKRITKGGIAYHVLNRANGKLRIFKKDLDFIAFENILAEGIERFSMRLCGYCIMSNHWHLLLWPAEDHSMSDFMHWVTVTHVRRWHTAHGTTGIGHLYQGRYKSFPIQHNHHYLKTMRYIETNPCRARIAQTPADWQWSSYAQRTGTQKPFDLNPGPLPIPEKWPQIVNEALSDKDTTQIDNCIKREYPYAQNDWMQKNAKILKLNLEKKKRGRPEKYV